MTQEFESRTSEQLFGEASEGFAKALGINSLYRVADTLEEFRHKLEEKGLGENSFPEDEMGTFGIITKDGVGLDFPFHYQKGEENNGVWIEDIDGYRDLLGLT